MHRINEVFESILKVSSWKLDLVKVTTSKKSGVRYNVQGFNDFSKSQLNGVAKSIFDTFMSVQQDMFDSVEEFEGEFISGKIYEFDKENELLKDANAVLIESLAHPDLEETDLKSKYDFYVLKGQIMIDDEMTSIKLFSVGNPVKMFRRNHFLKIDGKYMDITSEVLYLKPQVDVISVGDCVYFFNEKGEKIFNMERAYKTACQKYVTEVVERNIVFDSESFVMHAGSGHNPKKFTSFSSEILESLGSKECREHISQKFGIPLKEGMFDTSNKENCEKLIKVLCKKGALDPIDTHPLEVSSPKKWEV